MSDHGGDITETGPPTYPADRSKSFIDAIVAIAMTLLILPLMESAADYVPDDTTTTVEWLSEHSTQLSSFVLSFLIVAMFWIRHHRLFVHVKAVTSRFVWLLMLWALTIVWLPVATAITGKVSESDPVAKSLYIGSMIAAALLSLVIRNYLRRHPRLHDAPVHILLGGMAADLAMAALFAIALAIAIVFPIIGYYTLLIMLLTAPLQHVFARLFRPS